MRATLAGCCITVAMLTSQPGWATVFQKYQVIDYFSGSTPRAVTSAVLGGSANADLAVAGSDDNKLAVYPGNGDGSFGDAVLYDTGSNPFSVTHAILSAGSVDLVTANRDSDNVSVFLNNGSGVFSASTYPTGTAPVFVLAAELNGADNDLITANSDGNSISVLLNNGDGTFAAKTDYTTSLSTPAGVAAADIDGDTHLDLAVINQGDNTVAVFINDGSGGFTFDTSYATGSTPYAIAAGDLNNAGSCPDLVISNSDSDTISVLLNKCDGSGGFIAKQDYDTGTAPHTVVLEDFDQDTDLDIAVTNNESDTVSVFENSGTAGGTFNTRRDASSVKGPSGLAARDLDGDLYPELITTNLTSLNFAYLQNLKPVTPNEFSFDPVTDANLATDITSDPVTISGLATDAPISINANEVTTGSGTTYYDASFQINNDPFKTGLNTTTTIQNGDTVRVKVLSANKEGETVDKTLTIGGLEVTFSVTTRGDDMPAPFSITPRADAEPGELVISAPVTITGLGAPATIGISNGEYRINGGAFTSASGTLNNKDEIEVRVTASSSYGSQTSALLSIGGVQASFIVSTKDNGSSSGGGGSIHPAAALLTAALWRRRRKH